MRRYLRNIPGWKTGSRIVAIESDDWGSIRMPSLASFKKLEESGLNLRSWDAERYNLNDTLASGEDLASLFQVLDHFKDRMGKNAVFTAVSVVANPDFRRIREDDFRHYYYEPFTETLKRYPGCERSFELWNEGIAKKLFIPQMHGREHLNVIAWMRNLSNGDRQTRLAFDEGLWGFIPDQTLFPGIDYQAAFLLSDLIELDYHNTVIAEGLEIFYNLFGYRAEYFVPPNGPFNNKLNSRLVQSGIKYRYASSIQHETVGSGKTRKVLHWVGQKEKNGLRYISRNCFFEPNQPGKDWVDSCLNDIKIAFRLHKPAVISSHRVNYIGALNPHNRGNGLTQLETLLQAILKNWPDVHFLTTPEYCSLFDSNSYE